MASNYPGTLDVFTNPLGTQTLNSPDHAQQHGDVNDASEALQAKVGVGSGTPTANVALIGSGNGTSAWTATWNGPTLGTPVIDKFTTSGTTLPTVAQRGLAPTVVTIADSAGGTLTPNAAAGQVFMITLGTTAGNRNLGTPINATDGQAISIGCKASGSANGTLVWAAIYRISQDYGTPTIGTGTTWNYYGWRYNTTDSKWDFQGASKNVV